MKLQQLIYAVKVAECGNITEASRRLFVSQPSITASIRELEAEMGVTIFERSNKGVVVTEEGETFLGYARQVLEQVDLLEERYCGEARQVPHFSVSCQHYSFAVNAFVDVIRQFDAARYDFTLREEQTHEIIEDVSHMKSELGILYLSSRNREVIEKMLRQTSWSSRRFSVPSRTCSFRHRIRWRDAAASPSTTCRTTPISPTSRGITTRFTSPRRFSPPWTAPRTFAYVTAPRCSIW